MEKTLKPAGAASAGRTKRLVMTALFAALGCAATMVVKVPSPTGGYMNLGDTAVLLGAYCLGPVYGAAAGGVGPAMADLLGGYPVYVPATLIIKAIMGTTAGLLYKVLRRRGIPGVIACGVAGEVPMVLGYWRRSGLRRRHGLYHRSERRIRRHPQQSGSGGLWRRGLHAAAGGPAPERLHTEGISQSVRSLNGRQTPRRVLKPAGALY
jgi:uncharacterized membrane protein